MSTIAVRNANQMMISADIRDDGIFVSYADGKSGVVPFGEIEGIDGRASIERLELPNPHEVVLAMTDGSREELPWDFVRWHCDESFEARTEATIQRGQRAVGSRIRSPQAGERVYAGVAGGESGDWACDAHQNREG